MRLSVSLGALLISGMLVGGGIAQTEGKTATKPTYIPLPTINAEGEQVTAPPIHVAPIPDVLREQFKIHPFYKKHVVICGIPVIGADVVTDYALLECAWTLDHMLHDREMALKALVSAKVRVGVIGIGQYTMDIPENQNPRMMARAAYNDRRSRGLGGLPMATCAEENLLNLRGDPYTRENITIHEFAHTLASAIRRMDRGWYDKLREAYNQAKEKGIYGRSYASTNEQEYWAEGAQCWFDCANPRNSGGARNRDELKAKDAPLAELLTEVYGDTSWRYVKTENRTSAVDTAHLAGMDRAAYPVFRFSNSPRIKAEAEAREPAQSEPSPVPAPRGPQPTTDAIEQTGRAQETPAVTADQLERISSLCKVWGAVRYQHPYLAYREDIDWDAALIKALPKVEAAKTSEKFAAAVQELLDVLDDSATRVVRQHTPASPPPAANRDNRPVDEKWFTKPAEGVLAIDLSTVPNPIGIRQVPPQLTELGQEINKARGLIVDCRRASARMGMLQELVLQLVCGREAKAIGRRYVVHSGYRPHRPIPYSEYYSALETEFNTVFVPSPNQQPPKSIWLVGDRTFVPSLALAMQYAGDGFIVVQGKSSQDLVAPQVGLPLGDGYDVAMRTAELVTPDGEAYSFEPDAEVAADGDFGFSGPAFKTALDLLEHPERHARRDPGQPMRALAPALWRPDNDYPAMSYPDREHRVLALFRFWNVIRYFYPYKHLMDRDWDAALPEFLPKFLAARNQREYELAVLEMAALTQDSHTTVGRTAIGSLPITFEIFGESSPLIDVRWIEDAPVVVRLLDEKVSQDANVQIGDVIVRIDGESVTAWIERNGKYLAASTPQAHRRTMLLFLLGGTEGSICKLTLRGADGNEKDVELPRRSNPVTRLPHPPTKYNVFEILGDNLGYVDLTRLEVSQVDSMLERLKDTRAIIFDMRGYPRGVFGKLAPRLNIKNAHYAATFQRPFVTSADVGAGSGIHHSFLQPISAADKWKYQGKTVMLIDERAQSQSEHTGLFLEAACGVTFIGSHTAGANGDITNMFLPGGLRVTFGGHDVRHADGRQLQRIGLEPHIHIKPTIRGIREGKDEVLERAIEFLREGK